MKFWTDLVAVMTVYEADIIKGLLESSGIPARLFYESLEKLGIPLRVSLTGSPTGIRVQVPFDFLEKAREVLTACVKPEDGYTCRVRYKGTFKRKKTCILLNLLCI
jgi:hypothetical protein